MRDMLASNNFDQTFKLDMYIISNKSKHTIE